MRRSALLIKKFGECVFVCVCVCGGAAEREATEGWKTTSIWWSRAPFSIHFYPQHNHQIPPSLSQTHTHTADVLENRLKFCDGWSSPDRFHSSKAQSASAFSHQKDWLRAQSQIDVVFFCLGLCRVPLVPMEILAGLVHLDSRYPISNYSKIIMHQQHSNCDCFPMLLLTFSKDVYLIQLTEIIMTEFFQIYSNLTI